jgi:hypothetical protein
MENSSNDMLLKALQTINSMITRSENVQIKLKEGSAQASLTRNRLKALYIALWLVTKELSENFNMEVNYSKDDLEKAVPPITSTISKCKKIRDKSKEGTPQSTLSIKMINALDIALYLITRELNY